MRQPTAPLAWRVKDLPAELKRLPKDLWLLAKALYNAAVLAVAEDAVGYTMQELKQKKLVA